MNTTAEIPGPLDVDQALDLVLGENTSPVAAGQGELVAPAEELVAAFAATLVARRQTQRTYQRACARSIYLSSGPDRREHVIALRDRRRPILDDDRDSDSDDPDTAQPSWRGG